MASELAHKRHLQDEIKHKLDQHKDWLQQMQGENMEVQEDEDIHNVHRMPENQANQKQPSKKRWDQLYELNKLQKETREFMRQCMAEEMEEDPECTFHPKISEKSYHLVNKNRPGFVERNAIWLNQKEMKIKQLGENKEDKKLLHCTFQPQIHEHDSSIYTQVRPQTNQHNGVNKFLQRQQAAREEKARKVNAMEYRGLENTGRGKITIPREPKFSDNKHHHNVHHQYNSNTHEEPKTKSKFEEYYNNQNNTQLPSNINFGDAVRSIHDMLNSFPIDLD